VRRRLREPVLAHEAAKEETGSSSQGIAQQSPYRKVSNVLLGADYPFLDVLWTLLIFFCFVIWFMLLFRVFADIFRRHDIHGGGKTLWILFVILLPFLGVFFYLIAESKGMAERSMKDVQVAQEQLDDHIRSVSGGGSAAEIEKAKSLLDSGAITQAEFDAIKAKALA
jgi:Short C-terminal domain/Phospholipase_D-nuclease N-terminal